MKIELATEPDFERIHQIQKIAFLSEAEIYQNYTIQPLTQTLEELVEECREKIVLKAVIDNSIVGSIRANWYEKACWLNKLIVLPEYRRRGIGEKLLREIETYFPGAQRYILATGANSESNIRLYLRVGYDIVGYETFHDGVKAALMEKPNKK